MKEIAGTLFLLGVGAIAVWAAYSYVLYPIICFVKAGCGAASW